MTPTTDSDRRPILLIAVALLTFGAGWLGQGWSHLGSSGSAPALSATATDVIGGAGGRQPTQIELSLVVANAGTEQIRVTRPLVGGSGTQITELNPVALNIPGGRSGDLDAEVSLRCDLPDPLSLPALPVDFIDGGHEMLQISDSGLPLDACSRNRPTARPLAVAVFPQAKGQFTLRLTAPTGRPVQITAIRADGADLTVSGLPVRVAGQPVEVSLTAPPSCPPQWPGVGIPTALTFDLSTAPTTDGAVASVTPVQLYLGPALTNWLLTTACAARLG